MTQQEELDLELISRLFFSLLQGGAGTRAVEWIVADARAIFSSARGPATDPKINAQLRAFGKAWALRAAEQNHFDGELPRFAAVVTSLLHTVPTGTRLDSLVEDVVWDSGGGKLRTAQEDSRDADAFLAQVTRTYAEGLLTPTEWLISEGDETEPFKVINKIPAATAQDAMEECAAVDGPADGQKFCVRRVADPSVTFLFEVHCTVGYEVYALCSFDSPGSEKVEQTEEEKG